MTKFGAPEKPLDQARWIARQLLHVVRDEIGDSRADTIVAQLGHMTEGCCLAWIAPSQAPAGEEEVVSVFEAAQALGVKPRTVRSWTERYPRIVPRIDEGVRLVDCRRYLAMSTSERAAAA